ncbi:MAG: T9SS type A sorting domain-containing protein [Chlorobi bacterium]|nr:T9SS type A sorting domain-containing protein [Chlorobiota bacterium]
MKKILLLTMLLTSLGLFSKAQTVLFSDDYESYTVGTNIEDIQPNGAIGNYDFSRVDAGVVDADGNPTNCAKLTYNGSASRGSLSIPLDPALLEKGYTYQLTADLRNGSVVTDMRLYLGIEFYDLDGNRYRLNDGDVTVTDWTNDTTKFSYDDTYPDGVSELSLVVWINGVSEVYDCYVDNIIFEKIENTSTRISEKASYDLNISPNPSAGIFHVNSEMPVKGYQVFNSVGQLVKEANGINSSMTDINMSGANKGVYLVKVTYETGEVQIVRALLK